MGGRRDPVVVAQVGPFFKGWYAAYAKLEQVTRRACRSVKVGTIPALLSTFENYRVRCAPGAIMSFWGITSFSLEDSVVGQAAFSGAPTDDAIQYMCGAM